MEAFLGMSCSALGIPTDAYSAIENGFSFFRTKSLILVMGYSSIRRTTTTHYKLTLHQGSILTI